MAFSFLSKCGMKIQFHSSVIFVKDIEASKQFYCNILQQEVDTDFGNNITLKGGLSIWEIPDWHELNQNYYQKGESNKALEICFETDHIDEIVDLIEKQNLKKRHGLTEETWGQKTIRIYDPDNNLVEIGEKLEVFITRMHNEGLSVEKINKKTGVPKEHIEKILK